MTLVDLTRQKFGKLTVLGIDEENKYNSSNRIQWKCQCDCGNICYKTAESLKRPNIQGVKACSKSCGTAILIGQQFGELIVVEIVESNLYKCKCTCGNEVIKKGNDLKSGHVKSCGCYRQQRMSEIGKQYSEKRDLTNQQFGKLIAIKPTEKRINKSVVWECKCDCGKTHYASVSNLVNGYVTRCSDCQIYSKGEEKIKKLLIEANIPFVQQKTFEGCRYPETNALLRFDFYVDNKYIIEFDGIQHYKNGGWVTEEKLHNTQNRDIFKNSWCKKNNIPIIRIPYYQLEILKINDLLLKE